MTMRRKAVRQSRAPQAQVAEPIDWLAPVDGWHTDKPLEQLPPTAASTLVNFFPEAGYIRPRNGSNGWATGLGASVQTLMPWFASVGSGDKMFAAAGTNIYDVSSAGAVGAAVSTGLASSYLSWANFVNSGGNWLLAVSAGGDQLAYSGTTWGAAGITGMTNNLFVVHSYRERLWFLETGTSNLWFLPTLAITGALTGSINLGAIFQFGGLPVAIGTWVTPTINGPLELLCIMSSEGEVLIYQGSDPTNANNWSLLGAFKLGFPLGADKCFYSVGGDLAIMTVDGLVPMSKAITLDPSAIDQYALTGPIAPTWLSTVQSVGRATPGWQLMIYPARRMAVLNVPDPGSGIYQYVMNTETKAWTKFTGMLATVWLAWEGGLYFGTATGTVVQADIGANDQGAVIDCLSVGNWQRMKDGLSPKSSTLISVDAIVDSTATVYAGVSWDYTPVVPQALAGGASSAPALWDVALWDQAMWGGAMGKRLVADASGHGVVFAQTVRAVITGTAGQSSGCSIVGGTMHIQKGQGI
jgi:hypothetical protein